MSTFFNPIELVASKKLFTMSKDMLGFCYEYLHVMQKQGIITDSACKILAGLVKQEMQARELGISTNTSVLDQSILDFLGEE